MSVIGYSELLKEIHGITPESLQTHISKLLTAKPSEERIELLKQLATRKHATASELLRALHHPHTGGSFTAARAFLDRLVQLHILQREKIGRRTYYAFPDGSDLKAWLS